VTIGRGWEEVRAKRPFTPEDEAEIAQIRAEMEAEMEQYQREHGDD
jgi:hypothetical protein